jgi:hypothetical protein
MFTGDEECRMAGNGTAAGLHEWRRTWRWGEGVGAREGAKGQLQGLRVGFIGRGEGRRGDGRSNGHQWPWRAGGLDCHQGGRL